MSTDPQAAPTQPEEPPHPNSFTAKLKAKLIPEVLVHRDNLHGALERVVENSSGDTIHGSALSQDHHWLKDLFPAEVLDKLFSKDHMGNFVQIRGSDEKIFESMPLYARIGMHLLFFGRPEIRFLHANKVKKLLKDQSLKQGKIYDSEDPKIVQPHIQSFIKTYSVNLTELANPDLHSYKTINEFFARKLKPSARPITSPDDNTIITSAADSRLTVWTDIDACKKFWVKGKNFSIPELLGSAELAKQFGPKPSLAIFRLAPQDYHRFHTPVSGKFGKVTEIEGDYYTVNPQAVNEQLDVFTANKRNVAIVEAKNENKDGANGVPVAIVAVGALLVASIGWVQKEGDEIKKGDNIGWFQYGGSTVIAVFPTGAVTWDEDLVKTSDTSVETLVKVGDRIGKFNV